MPIRITLTSFGALLVAGAVIACGAQESEAADRAASKSASVDSQQAQSLVAAALQAEAAGELLARQQLLQSAERCDPDCAELKWQQGYVRIGDRWLSIDACIDSAASHKGLAEYETRRSQLADLLPAHLELAQWCASQKLYPQSQAHFERVLQFDSDHAAARLALGYQLIGAEWISPQQVALLAAKTEEAKSALTAYGETLQQIARDLHSPHDSRQQAARQALMAIEQADSIAAVQSVFRSASDEVSAVVVQWLAKQDNVAGSSALLSYAVQHTSPTVRAAAAEALKERPLHDYVPELLGMLSSPVIAMTVPSFNRDGSLAGYQQAFARESVDRTQVFAINTQIARERQTLTFDAEAEPRRGGAANRLARQVELIANNEAERNVRRWADLETRALAALTQQQNQEIAAQNEYVLQLLSTVADREFSDDPREAWAWWDEVNETGYQRSKPLRYREQRQGLTLASYQVPRPAHECFVAGTPVLTTRGLKPIEAIVAGDTLFARDVNSGALLVKPVLQATRRPAEPTLEIIVDSERLQCTAGHLFWVSGAGWKKASELSAGDVLHAAQEPVVVVAVKAASSQVTYNLQVADCRTFFVGRSRVLSHDVTQRQASDHTVPGLNPAQP